MRLEEGGGSELDDLPLQEAWVTLPLYGGIASHKVSPSDEVSLDELLLPFALLGKGGEGLVDGPMGVV